MRVDHAGDLGPQRFGFGGVDADAGGAARRRDVEHVEDAAAAGHDGGQPAGEGAAAAAGVGELLAFAAVEQLEAARHRVGAVARLDGVPIGRIGEGEPAGRVAHPDRAPAARRSGCASASTSLLS